ncbi:hypothetical protein MJ581_12160 [Escherichia coli]|nr:hypothetical protein MJ581_12160 [Escherichia coli]
MENESPGCDSNFDPRCDWQESTEAKQSSSKHPAAVLAAYAVFLLAIHEDKEWRKALVKLITATPELGSPTSFPWLMLKSGRNFI